MAEFCSADEAAYCPSGGCPDTVLAGGERVPAGCARGLGWTPADGDVYPVALAAAVAVSEATLPDYVAELAWHVKARGDDDMLAMWVALRRGVDEWVVKDALRERYLYDWEWCYLRDDVKPDRFTAASVLNLIPPLLLGEARDRWARQGRDPDRLVVVAGHVDGPEVEC